MAYSEEIIARGELRLKQAQQAHRDKQEALRREIYAKLPRTKEIDSQLRKTAPRILAAALRKGLDQQAALAALREMGYAMAVASSTDTAKTVAHLEHAGLLDWFSACIGGDQVRHSKPEPDIFLLAAQRLGAAPEDCVVVGDTPADVLAATAAGMRVVLIPDCVPANEQTTALSWKILSSLEELPEELG